MGKHRDQFPAKGSPARELLDAILMSFPVFDDLKSQTASTDEEALESLHELLRLGLIRVVKDGDVWRLILLADVVPMQ